MTTFPAEPLAILLSELLRVEPPTRRGLASVGSGLDEPRAPRAWAAVERGARHESRKPAAAPPAVLGRRFVVARRSS